MKPELMNALTLAYLGDAVFEVYVREYLILEKNIQNSHALQKASVSYVSADAQALFIKETLVQGFLTKREIDVYRRGRNTKTRRIKNVINHNHSSGFEALIGTLYLENNKTRIKEIFEKYKEIIEKDEI